MKRTASISIILAGLFASMAQSQQPNAPLSVALLTCAERPAAKPNLFQRVFHRKQKNTPIVRVFHESDFRMLLPDRADHWRQDEAKRLGLHVPSRFCATALPPAPKLPAKNAAAASAAKP